MIKGYNSSYPSREYFERAASLFKEVIEHNKIHFSMRSEMVIEQLQKVKMSPNRRLNLLTIDELVRTNLHMMNSDMLDKKYENRK